MIVKKYILTRFNLRLWSRDKYFRKIERERWLDERFRLFETYCLPAVKAQTEQDFRWFLLIDRDTPPRYKERMQRYKQAYPAITWVEVAPEHSSHFGHIFAQIVANDLLATEQEVSAYLTTYLDNDDAPACNYMQRISQACLHCHESTIFTFPHGLQYFEKMNIATGIRYPNNHFLTLFEPYLPQRAIRTVYNLGSHGAIYKHRCLPIRELGTAQEPAWAEIIHSGNVANDIGYHWRASLVTQKDILVTDFGINKMLSNSSRRIFYTRYLLRYIFEIFRYNFFRTYYFVKHKWQG